MALGAGGLKRLGPPGPRALRRAHARVGLQARDLQVVAVRVADVADRVLRVAGDPVHVVLEAALHHGLVVVVDGARVVLLHGQQRLLLEARLLADRLLEVRDGRVRVDLDGHDLVVLVLHYLKPDHL